MKKILILGGGFAGIQTALELQKKKLFEVTLVSERDSKIGKFRCRMS